LAEGEARYDDLEQRLADAPVIGVPTITLEGDANGAPHPEPAAYRQKFSGPYEHRTLTGGIGHNLPQEAPMWPRPDRLPPTDGRVESASLTCVRVTVAPPMAALRETDALTMPINLA
jgi:hypothetical protein